MAPMRAPAPRGIWQQHPLITARDYAAELEAMKNECLAVSKPANVLRGHVGAAVAQMCTLDI